MCGQCKRSLCESRSHVDFAAAGKDATAMVSSVYCIIGGTRVKDDGPSGLHDPMAKNNYFPRGPSGYQSKGDRETAYYNGYI